ncbi:MAG: AI-2E family transporter [Hyphomicrobium sp.]
MPDTYPTGTEKLRSLGLSVIAMGVVVTGLVLGSSFLIPLAIAVLLWNLLEALIGGLAGLSVGRFRLPRWLATLLALALIASVLYLIAVILLGQADAIAAAWPRYEERLKAIIASSADWLGPEHSTRVRAALGKIDVMRQATGLFTSVQSFVLSLILVALYVGFLLGESRYLAPKIATLFPDAGRAREVSHILSAISDNVRRYIWLKTMVSLLTGVLSYAVLRAMSIDFAETWALMIFVLNYIPNVGSVLGVIFPAVLAFVQFDTIAPFLAIAIGLTMIQLVIGNVVEPMLMGSSLNMSAFAIILSLTLWSAMWGIVGMFLSVPIMVMVMIVCANVPSWRWVAILLSRDGRIEKR